MFWADLLSHAPVIDYLSQVVQTNRVPHALLFSGPEGVGKQLAARITAAQLHAEDVRFFQPDYTVEAMRDLLNDAILSGTKVFIFDRADQMSPVVANTLLKTLEEPPAGTTFILLTHRRQELLSTILSRCIELRFHPLPPATVAALLTTRSPDTSPLDRDRAVRLSQGSIGRALKFLTKECQSRAQALHKVLTQGGGICEGIEEWDQEELLAEIFLWYRDQGKDLERIEAALREMQNALSRQIKASVCLDRLLSRLRSS